MNVLITSVNNKVLLVKQFKQAAINYSNTMIFSGDIDANVSGALFSDKHLILPKDNDPLFIDKVKQLCIDNNIKLIIPTRDEELKIFSLYKEDLNKIGCNVIVPSISTLEICQNKYLFFKFCESNNIDVPKTYWDIEDIKYPAFSKPTFGKASKGAFKINSDEDLKIFSLYKEELNMLGLKNIKDNIIQEYVDWQEYTVDLFSDLEHNIISVVPRKRIKIVNGESHIGETENNQYIINKTIDLAKKLKLIGHNVIQCFYKNNTIKFIEVNPRYGGASNLSFKSGANTPEFLLKLIRKQPIKPIKNFTNKLKMYRHSTDVFINENIINKIFCVDIDGTLCTENCKYEDSKPIKKIITKINKLYKDNTIILHTARGASSGYDWRPLTEHQLKTWGVKYHNLIMGKPYADYYIDNKSINVLEWI